MEIKKNGSLVQQLITCVYAICVVFAILSTIATYGQWNSFNLDVSDGRINCFPEQQGSSSYPWSITGDQCTMRGCAFDSGADFRSAVPPCYMLPDKIGYAVVDGSLKIQNDTVEELELGCFSSKAIFGGPIVSPVIFYANVLSDTHLRIRIYDPKHERYEVPQKNCKNYKSSLGSTWTSALYNLSYVANPFSFQITRKSTGTVVFDSSLGGFVFENQFLQLSTKLPSQNLYGLGESEHANLRHDLNYRTWPLFARDQPGLGEGLPLYGVHPMYLVLENDGNANGAFLLNSNAMEFSLTPFPALIMRTIGGIFDLHFYLGPTPNAVIQQHSGYVGRPFLPPYWSLGFHLSRYGYNNAATMQEAVNRTRQYGIPLDVIFADIDHMDERKDFTLNAQNFGDMPSYIRSESDQNGLHLIIITDPAVTNNATGYEAWDVLSGNQTFITWPNATVMMGYVWPSGKVAFPDFSLQQSQKTWAYLIAKHVNLVPFSGLWIDMNEPSNFGTNLEKPFNWPPNLPPWSLKCPESSLEDPPYRTWAVSRYDSSQRRARISDSTLCMTAKFAGSEMYNTHSLYGFFEAPATLKGVQLATGKRGIVLTRSSFAGSGKWAAHWLGDNLSTWDHLRKSVIGMIEMSIFGIAQVGADICGFTGQEPSEELCRRWMELGSFYPFSRNHNDLHKKPQDPGYFGPIVANASRSYLLHRYATLPYLYSLFYEANQFGLPVIRAVFFEFSTDNATWALDNVFLLGSAYLVAPVLNEGQNGPLLVYLPKDNWIHRTSADLKFYNQCSGGSQISVMSNLPDASPGIGPAIFQRGGSITVEQRPKQSSDFERIVSTKLTRKNPFDIFVVFNCTNLASGLLFWDDGESISTIEAELYWLLHFSSSKLNTSISFNSSIVHASKDASLGSGLEICSINFFGADSQPQSFSCSPPSACSSAVIGSFMESAKMVSIQNLTVAVFQEFNLQLTW